MSIPTPNNLSPVRACARCGRLAAYRRREGDEDLCEAHGCFLAGQYCADATRDRDVLNGAVAGLLASGLDGEAIRAMVDGELEGKSRPYGPDNAHPGDPWAWVTHVLEPIT